MEKKELLKSLLCRKDDLVGFCARGGELGMWKRIDLGADSSKVTLHKDRDLFCESFQKIKSDARQRLRYILCKPPVDHFDHVTSDRSLPVGSWAPT